MSQNTKQKTYSDQPYTPTNAQNFYKTISHPDTCNLLCFGNKLPSSGKHNTEAHETKTSTLYIQC